MKATKAGEQPAVWVTWGCVVVHNKSTTTCKHGVGNCDVCGTNERTDKKHTTVGGTGLVARLRKRKE